jgi:hypothetical protein
VAIVVVEALFEGFSLAASLRLSETQVGDINCVREPAFISENCSRDNSSQINIAS